MDQKRRSTRAYKAIAQRKISHPLTNLQGMHCHSPIYIPAMKLPNLDALQRLERINRPNRPVCNTMTVEYPSFDRLVDAQPTGQSR